MEAAGPTMTPSPTSSCRSPSPSPPLRSLRLERLCAIMLALAQPAAAWFLPCSAGLREEEAEQRLTALVARAQKGNPISWDSMTQEVRPLIQPLPARRKKKRPVDAGLEEGSLEDSSLSNLSEVPRRRSCVCQCPCTQKITASQSQLKACAEPKSLPKNMQLRQSKWVCQ